MRSDAHKIQSFQDLLALLVQDQVLHQSTGDPAAVAIPTRRGAMEGMLLLRWQAAQGVVQFVQSLPLEVPPDRVSAVEDALVRLNHALALPGFGLNPTARTVYFRVVLPLHPSMPVTDMMVRALFSATVRNAADFLPVLQRVALEGASPEHVVADAQVDMALKGQG